jgi:hypothetical protein
MTKLLFFLSAGYLIHTVSLAQGKFSLGIDAGLRIEKAVFDDPKGYLFRDLWPSGTIGLSGTYAHSKHWEFELGVYRTTFNNSVSAFYREPGYFTMTRVGNKGGGGFSSLQIPIRAIYASPVHYKKFKLLLLGGINLFQQVQPTKTNGFIGAGTEFFPQPDFNIAMDYTSSIVNRTSVAFEIGPEIRYDLSRRIYLAYRLSATMGTRDMVSIEGNYFVSNSPWIVHDFEVTLRGRSINHFISLRYRLGEKVRPLQDWENED